MMQIDGDNVTIIPEGFKWCPECEGLTRHSGDAKRYSMECQICGSMNFCDEGCPNCGAPDPLEEDPGPDPVTVVIHHDGCHCQGFKDEDQNLELFEGRWLCTSHAEQLAFEFRESWMAHGPAKKAIYSTPKDWAEHKRITNLERAWYEAKNVRCGCPRELMFHNPQVFNYSSRSVFSMDCVGAIEWGYQVRCPICGLVYDVHDSNC